MTRFDELMLQFFMICMIGLTGFLILSGIFSHEAAVMIVRFFFIGSAAVGITYGLVRLIQKLTAHGLKLDIMRSVVLKKSNQAAFGVHVMDNGLCLNYQTGTAQYFTKHRQPKAEIPITETPAIPENVSVINSLDLLSRCDSVLIAGGKGAGKTNLAFHLADMQLRSGCQVFVIDPKPQFEAGKWFGAKVIGANHNYSEITSFLSDLTGVMKDDRNQIRIWIDELTVLNMQIKRFASLWLPVLIEGREYGKFVSIIGQSKTAGSVGLEGRYDLLDCFDAIAVCRHNKASGERFTEIELAGEGMVIGTAPERFRMIGYHHPYHESPLSRQSQTDFRAESDRSDSGDKGDRGDSVSAKNAQTERLEHHPDMRQFPRRIFESKAEKQAVEMHESGKSPSAIASAIFGGKSGARVKQVKAWIEKNVM
ncbi:MAG: hypothetical protein HC887_00055 [Desulfobacteraceae bacterium]|nr:hypothetical protein [Desulfobacteraceae bacterium]